MGESLLGVELDFSGLDIKFRSRFPSKFFWSNCCKRHVSTTAYWPLTIYSVILKSLFRLTHKISLLLLDLRCEWFVYVALAREWLNDWRRSFQFCWFSIFWYFQPTNRPPFSARERCRWTITRRSFTPFRTATPIRCTWTICRFGVGVFSSLFFSFADLLSFQIVVCDVCDQCTVLFISYHYPGRIILQIVRIWDLLFALNSN